MSSLNDPILPGTAATDYERYLRTDELLSLQKPLAAMAHRDELLFQTIHQVSELWLKLACAEIDEGTARLDRDETWGAVRVLRRASDALDLVSSSTLMLEHIAPWDYHHLRPALGHGSGFDSPGFRRTHDVSPSHSTCSIARATPSKTSSKSPSVSSIGTSASCCGARYISSSSSA
jgi:tryptophan 2,3-dioxygenase